MGGTQGLGSGQGMVREGPAGEKQCGWRTRGIKGPFTKWAHAPHLGSPAGGGGPRVPLPDTPVCIKLMLGGGRRDGVLEGLCSLDLGARQGRAGQWERGLGGALGH